MEALVTGATGLVGANVVRALLKEGVSVRVLVRRTSNDLALRGLPVARAEGDCLDLSSVKRAVKGCALVFHVAGEVYMGEEPDRVQRMFRVNVEGTRNLCEAALQEGVEKFVYTSSASTIGRAKVADEKTDNAHIERDGMPYAQSKKRGEEVVLEWVKKGLPAVVVNPTLMFGAWDVKPTSGRMLLLAKKAWIPFYPTGSANVIDVEDAAQGHLLAWKRGRVGERYILGCANITYRELLTKIARLVGKPPPVVPLFPLPTKALATAVSPLRRFLPAELREVFSVRAIEESADRGEVSSQKAIRELGLPQSSIDSALERAYQWLLEQGYF